MVKLSDIFSFLIYKGPKEYNKFELLEDETEDTWGYGGEEDDEDRDTFSGNVLKDREFYESLPYSQQDFEDTFSKKTHNKEEQGKDKASDNIEKNDEKQKNLRQIITDKTPRDPETGFKKPMDIDEWAGIRKAEKDRAKELERSEEKGFDHENSEDLSKALGDNLSKIKKAFNMPYNKDIVIREFKIQQKTDAFIVYADGMADNSTINNFILRQLMKTGNADKDSDTNTADFIASNLLSANQIIKIQSFDGIIKQVLNGLTALFIDGSRECIVIESRGFEKRAVSEPMIESVIRGSQEAFVESLRTNLTLIRRIIRNKDLITEITPIGKVNNTDCAIMYVKGITNPKLVREVKRRISSIDIDYLASNGVLDQLIEDHPFGLLPQILSTERPDRAASFLMQGKVIIICEGTPFASIVPVTIFHMFHTSEDYSLRWQYATFLRLVRGAAVFFAVFLPGLYIALTLFHQEMIPTELLLSLNKAGEKIPFSAVMEILVMEISFELIREAGVRVPGLIGQTLGIIGAVILGQAAVAAGLVSPVLIIIVAISGLGSFAIPNFSVGFGARIIRFIFIFAGALAGFYGMAAAMLILTAFMCSMKSFGVPYVSPIAPKTKSCKDTIIKMPTWLEKERPDVLNTVHRKRVENNVRGWADDQGKG